MSSYFSIRQLYKSAFHYTAWGNQVYQNYCKFRTPETPTSVMNLTPTGSLDLSIQTEGSFFCIFNYGDTNEKFPKEPFNTRFQNKKHISEIKNIGT